MQKCCNRATQMSIRKVFSILQFSRIETLSKIDKLIRLELGKSCSIVLLPSINLKTNIQNKGDQLSYQLLKSNEYNVVNSQSCYPLNFGLKNTCRPQVSILILKYIFFKCQL